MAGGPTFYRATVNARCSSIAPLCYASRNRITLRRPKRNQRGFYDACGGARPHKTQLSARLVLDHCSSLPADR